MNKSGGLLSLMLVAVVGVWMLLATTGNLPIKVFLVQSGSMEPTIMTGDVIVVANDNISLNDVVTFRDSTNRVVTHRIIEVNKGQEFVTKGDANRNEDRETIRESQIIGKVVMVIPKVGFLINFSKTLPGMIVLIFVPAFIFVISELKNIGDEIRRKK